MTSEQLGVGTIVLLAAMAGVAKVLGWRERRNPIPPACVNARKAHGVRADW